MAPKSHVFVVMAFLFAIQATYSNQCDNFYAKVTYALSHGKKAMEATNFEHQMYYAERALTALEIRNLYGRVWLRKSQEQNFGRNGNLGPSNRARRLGSW